MSEVKTKQSINLSLDLRYVVIALLVIIGVLVFLWKPWANSASARTIEANGTSTIEAEPDEFQFSPSYQEKGSDRAVIQKRLMDKVSGIVTKLKSLGVAESDIVLASSTYDNYFNDGTNEITSNSLTITIKDKDLAQKVQDYLITTSPQGQITPYPTFSDKKRKELESNARIEAIKDAKKSAQSSADELGAKLGKVISVSDSSSDLITPMLSTKSGAVAMDATSGTATVSSLPLTPGKQKIPYTVKVKYEIK